MLVRRAGGDGDTGELAARPIRWQRVAVAAGVVFASAVGAITAVEAVAGQLLASLFGNRPRPGASTSIGVVVSGQRGVDPAGNPGAGYAYHDSAGRRSHHDRASGDDRSPTTAVTATTLGTKAPTIRRR